MTNQQIKPTRQTAIKVLEVLSHGLTKGKGRPIPGQMCVEAAVCFALGLPHSDEPPCVGLAVRAFKIALNDAQWSSDMARAKGMRRIAVAQLGSDTIDQNVFVKELALETIHQLVPMALMSAAQLNPKHKDELTKHAKNCEAAKDLNAAHAAAHAAADAAAAAARAAAHAAAAARAAAHAAADAARAARDKVLCLMADIGVEALKKAGSPGCEWLNLVN